MTCVRLELGGGEIAWVCAHRQVMVRGHGACVGCHAPATLLCDNVEDRGDDRRTVTTCDSPLCSRCATEIAPDRHLCPRHAAAHAAAPRGLACCGPMGEGR